MSVRQWLGRSLAQYLGRPGRTAVVGYPTDMALLAATVRPGDVLLVEGSSRVSTAIKYLTQSNWSHAALYVGALDAGAADPRCVVEADISDGVRAVPLSRLAGYPCRICRPASLNESETLAVCRYAVERIGLRYDLKNIIDLARYLLPTPPVPLRWRRQMLALGSGDPTRAICSTLIAQAFQSVRYPILPIVETAMANDPACQDCVRQILHVRHHSLYAPRDFDVSPYFAVISRPCSMGLTTTRWSGPAPLRPCCLGEPLPPLLQKHTDCVRPRHPTPQRPDGGPPPGR